MTNTPIINPWFFYFAGIADTLRLSLIFFGCITIFAVIIFFCTEVDEDSDFATKASVRGLIIGIIVTLLGLFCPSEDTCYKIALAKYATPQNIQAITEYVEDTTSNVTNGVSDAIKDIMDYSVDRIYNIRNNQKVGDDAK